MKLLIERGADARAVDGKGRSALAYLARVGSLCAETARMVVGWGADPLCVDSEGRGPAWFAASIGCVTTLKSLEGVGCRIGAPGCDGEALLAAAMQHKNWPVMTELLRRGARIENWAAHASSVQNMVYYPATEETILVLVALGAPLSETDVVSPSSWAKDYYRYGRAQAAAALGLGPMALELLQVEHDPPVRAKAARLAIDAAIERGREDVAQLIRAYEIRNALAARLSGAMPAALAPDRVVTQAP
jgi:hypothetical protein